MTVQISMAAISCVWRLPKASCLTIVKGSHKGPMYDNVLPVDREKVQVSLPPIPNVEKLQEAGEQLDGRPVELLAWDLNPGDCVKKSRWDFYRPDRLTKYEKS